MVAQEVWDELFLDGLDDIGFAGAIDEEEHGQLAVDLGDVTFKNDLSKDGAHEGLAFDVFEQLLFTCYRKTVLNLSIVGLISTPGIFPRAPL